MIYVIEDNIDERVWMCFDAPNDRSAIRVARQNIIKFTKDVDFSYTLKRFEDLPSLNLLPVVTTSEEMFKEQEKEEEENE